MEENFEGRFERKLKIGGASIAFVIVGMMMTIYGSASSREDDSSSQVETQQKNAIVTTTVTTSKEEPKETTTAVKEKVETGKVVTKLIPKQKAKQKEKKASTRKKKVKTSIKTTTTTQSSWNGPILNPSSGRVEGPSGTETYYNLDMSGCIAYMQQLGFQGKYWVRSDGVKMYGSYIMCAANLNIRPKGTVVETSLGKAIVVDTGGFAYSNPTQLDIAVTW